MARILQLNETLAYMAALVRENPNITVREIADKMKFADNKSVYYWLAKANYHGIGEFKQAILTEQNKNLDGIVIKQNNKNKFIIKVPLRNWAGKKSRDGLKWFHIFHDYPNPRGLFATIIETNEFSPWFSEKDLIVVDTSLNMSAKPWVLCKKGRSFLIVRYGPQNSIYHPSTLKPCSRSGIVLLGPIIKLLRDWE